MAKVPIFGLGGVSCGGKSTLSSMIRKHIGEDRCETFNQDDYYWPEDHSYWRNDGTDNWDAIESFDMDRLIRDVREKMSCVEVKLIIIEGIMIYEDKRLDELIEYKYFITLPFDVCKLRRVKRNYIPPEPFETYFEDIYWPVYEAQLVEAKQRHDLTFVDSTQSLATLEEILRKEIDTRVSF